jgi:thymidylate synthase ThyX
LLERNVHKQIVNRLLEPFSWITVVCTGNEKAYENFFKLRCHPDAEPHIQHIANLLRDAYADRETKHLNVGEWHAPFFGLGENDEQHLDMANVISVARCARVSYVKHEEIKTIAEDMDLYARLSASGHWSPFEHVASASLGVELGGNLGMGWMQLRKTFIGEY